MATLYQLTPKYVAYYEIECLIQDITVRGDGTNLSIDCFKGGGVRWFEKLTIRKLGANRLGLTFHDRKPPVGRNDGSQTILNRCPAEKRSETPKRVNKVSQWTHNGSTVTFQETNGSFEIDYLQPKKGMMDVGVRTETMLFFGNREGDAIEGKAYIFHPRCGPLPYDVQGTLSSGANRLTLSGISPRVGSGCEVIKGVLEALTFERMH